MLHNELIAVFNGLLKFSRYQLLNTKQKKQEILYILKYGLNTNQ